MSGNETGQPKNPLGTEPIVKLLMRYAIPSVLAMLATSIYNIVDQIFIGRDVGYLGNAATTVAFPVVTISLAIALLVGNGASAFISLEMGRGNTDNAKKILGNAFVLLAGGGVLLGALVLIFLRPLMQAMGATEAVMPYALGYMGWIAIGFPFNMIAAGLTAVIRADGSPRYSMVATMSGCVLNVILDPIFIFVFKMGVEGAAIATVISQVVSATMTLLYLFRFANHTPLQKKNMRITGAITRRTCAYGSSSFITQAAITVVNVVLNNSLTYYGAGTIYGSEIPLSAAGIVMKINAIFLSCILGVVVGAQPILGFNYGAQNYRRVRRTFLTETAVTLGFAVTAWLLFMTIPHVFIGIFGDSDPLFNEFAIRYMRVFLGAVFAAGIQIPSANYFQSVGKPVKAMTLSMSRQLVFLVTAMLVLPLFLGLDGILYSGPVADLGALLVTGFFIVREMRSLSVMSENIPAPSQILATEGSGE